MLTIMIVQQFIPCICTFFRKIHIHTRKTTKTKNNLLHITDITKIIIHKYGVCIKARLAKKYSSDNFSPSIVC